LAGIGGEVVDHDEGFLKKPNMAWLTVGYICRHGGDFCLERRKCDGGERGGSRLEASNSLTISRREGALTSVVEGSRDIPHFPKLPFLIADDVTPLSVEHPRLPSSKVKF